MAPNDPPNYTAPPQTHPFTALLFDMDGTLIDSTPAITKYWTHLGHEIGVPGATILQTSHGRRSIDVLRLLAPDKATWAFVCAREAEVPVRCGGDAVEIPGSRALVAALEAAAAPWAIVTSGTRPLVTGWLGVMGLARPAVLVTAEEVARGKPDPACYRLGARRLGFDDGSGEGEGEAGGGGRRAEAGSFLVLEDAPAGVRAGKAAGYRVLAVGTTHAVEQLREAGADWVVRDLRSVRFVGWEEGRERVMVEVRDALVW